MNRLCAVGIAICFLCLPVGTPGNQAHAADNANASGTGLMLKARQAYRRGDHTAALTFYKQALPLVKGSDLETTAYSGMADSYCNLKQYPATIKNADEAIALLHKEQSTDRVKGRLAWLYYQKSKSETALGHPDTAIANLTSAIEARPIDQAYFLNRARLYVKVGRNNDAVNDLTTSLALSVKDIEANLKSSKTITLETARIKVLYERAKVYKSLGRTKEYDKDMAEGNKLTEQL